MRATDGPDATVDAAPSGPGPSADRPGHLLREEALRRQLEAISAVISAGLKDHRFDRVLERMVREARDGLGWEQLAVLLRGTDGSLRVAAQLGFGDEVTGRRVELGCGVVGDVLLTGVARLAADTAADPRQAPLAAATRSAMCAPLRIGEELRGALHAESPTPHRFGPGHLDALVRLAEQVGLVLHNVELLEAERETVARLEELDRLKADFIVVTGHELRTPLTAVLGFAEMLHTFYDRLTDEQRRSALDALVRQARLLARLVDDVLVATRIERRQLDVQLRPVPVGEAVTDVVRSVTGAIEVDRSVDDVVVRADPVRLSRVLGNVVDNAVVYGEGAPVTIAAEEVDGWVHVHVHDLGPGIPEREQERIFDRFHQVGQHGVHGRRGLGLGLTIARDLARLMGGDVTLASAPGRGSTFTLRLPSAVDGPRRAGRDARRSRGVHRPPRPAR